MTIQEMINSCTTGLVLVSPGNYAISETLEMVSGVDVVLSRGAKLRMVADVDVIHMRPGMTFRGGDIYLTETYTASAVVFDGKYQFGRSTLSILTGVSIHGWPSKMSGNGVRLYAGDADQDKVDNVIIRDVAISNVQNAIDLQVLGENGTCWVNGNLLDNISVGACETIIKSRSPLTHVPGGVVGNRFLNFFHQASNEITPDPDAGAIHTQGYFRRNVIHGLSSFDWRGTYPDRPFVVCDEYAVYNRFVLAGVFDLVADNGTGNEIISLRPIGA